MQSEFKRPEAGFSLVEMLVVIALIGILSLISVPAFMNYRNQNTFRSDLRNFTHDLRMARQYAIANSVQTRVALDFGNQSSKNYYFYSSADNGTTWTPLVLAGSHGATPGTTGNIKTMEGLVWINSVSGLPDADSDTRQNDIVYWPSGAMTLANGATSAQVVLRCLWQKIAYDTFTIGLSASGQVNSTGSHS